MGRHRHNPGITIRALLVALLELFGPACSYGSSIRWQRLTVADGLPSSRILCVATDNAALWAGTDSGLVLIEAGRIRKVFTPKDGLAGRAVTALSLDSTTGDLWIATYGGVSRYSAGRFQTFLSLTSGLANDVVYDIAAHGQFVWIATAAGLSRLDLRTGSWTSFTERNSPMADPWPTSLAFGIGKVYVGTWGSGELEYNSADEKWLGRHIEPMAYGPTGAHDQSATRRFVTSLEFDPVAGSVWIGSHMGLEYLSNRETKLYRADNSGLASNHVNKIRLHSNELWICTDRGISVLDTVRSAWLSNAPSKGMRGQIPPSGTSNSTVETFDVAFQDNDIWVASDNGLLHGVRTAGPGRRAIAADSDRRSEILSGRSESRSNIIGHGNRSAGTVNIGFFGPLESGPDTSSGVSMLHGAQLAIQEANEANTRSAASGKKKRKYNLLIHDDSAPWGASSVEPAKMALDENVIAILGSLDGAATHTLLRISDELGLPVINTATSDPSIRMTGSPWLIPLFPDDRQQCRALAQYIIEQSRIRKLGLIREDARYARIGSEALKNEFDGARGVTLLESTFPTGSTDFVEQLAAFQKAGIDGVVIWSKPAEAALILRQMRARNMQLPAFGPSILASSQLISLGGPATEGFVAVSTVRSEYETPAEKEFERNYLREFGQPSDVFARFAFDGVNLLIAAIEQTTLDRRRVMEELRDHVPHTRIAPRTADQSTDNQRTRPSLSMARVQNGKFVPWMITN